MGLASYLLNEERKDHMCDCQKCGQQTIVDSDTGERVHWNGAPIGGWNGTCENGETE